MIFKIIYINMQKISEKINRNIRKYLEIYEKDLIFTFAYTGEQNNFNLRIKIIIT